MITQRDAKTGRVQPVAPDTETHRWCPMCEDWLPKDQFYGGRRGLTRRCKRHHAEMSYSARRKSPEQLRLDRGRRLQRRYGITLGEWDEMLLAQSGRCAICADPMTTPHTDHCHQTGRVRALLCSGCNQGLGNFKDDPERVLAAARYLGVR